MRLARVIKLLAMAFDGLHIIWTTYNTFQPQDARGDWSALRELYKHLARVGFYCEMSAPLPENVSSAASSHNAVVLAPHERNEVQGDLFQLTSVDGDRVAGGLPLSCCAANSTAVQLLLAPALASHSQIIGRLKSKTASQLLQSPERTGQKRIWSSGYWFANINGEEALARVERFIQQQRGN